MGIGGEIAVVVSRRCDFSLVSKVDAAESLRFSCLLICVDSASRRWGWSLCMVQILGFAVWSGCRCCWRQSMMWVHWWQSSMIDVPVLQYFGLTGVVSKSPWSISASPSCEHGLDTADAGCRGCVINVLVCSVLGLIRCVSMWPQVLVLVRAVIRLWTSCSKAVAWSCRNGC